MALHHDEQMWHLEGAHTPFAYVSLFALFSTNVSYTVCEAFRDVRTIKKLAQNTPPPYKPFLVRKRSFHSNTILHISLEDKRAGYHCMSFIKELAPTVCVNIYIS